VRKGWQTKPIGDVFRVVNGGTPKTGTPAYWDGDHAWITPAEMGNLDTPFISASRRTLTDEGLRTGAELVPVGSVILSSRAPIGHLVINEIPMAFNQGCKGLIPSPEIDAKFAYYFLLANVPLLESLGTGATFKELSGGKLKEVLFHFPALDAQHRIVTLLDEAFADIATAKANAEKNLLNARELANELSAQILSAPSANCTIQSLEEIVEADCSLSYGIVQPGDEFESGLPIVRPVNLDRPLIELGGLKRIDPTLAKGYERTKLKGGEVLLCVRGTTGTLSCASSALAGANVTRGIVPIRFNPQSVSQELGYFLMRSAPVQAQIRAKTYGTALMQINIRDLRQIQIPVPHPSQQAAIAKALQDAEEQTNRLTEIQGQKLTALEDLKKSLLHQAFSGQLSQ